ncbi:DUF429 domain-containing protein [Pyrodictium abyssi]|uniref:DUF429 domain-containing protein n=1 Tax=Pyrodictium abyssi TaxID=54256 RepID=A0ABM8J076_9CREN|nr:DUF429 domain-containing protein [Pyrodictium abyssi]
MPCFAGVDLAALPRKPTGVAIICALESRELPSLAAVSELYHDDEITQLLLEHNVSVAAIDAPLSLPPPGHGFRHVERKLLSIGGRLLPLTMEPMRRLAERANELRKVLDKHGITVIETHPTSVLRVGKCSTYHELYSLFGLHPPSDMSRHEMDALVAALVAYCVHRDCGLQVSADDGVLYVLRPGICSDTS